MTTSKALSESCAELCDLYEKWTTGNDGGYGLDAQEAARCMDLADEIGRHVPRLIAAVERLTTERDALKKQKTHALRTVETELTRPDPYWMHLLGALEAVQRILGDDETETQ